ncbi:MAG: GMC oxidoreductase [Bacteroidia bacterium]
MKRKDFLKLGAIVAGGVFLNNKLSAKLLSLNRSNDIDLVIVGSGYGAAVTALRLAQKGIKCTIIEMGYDWGKSGIAYSNLLQPGKSAAWLRTSTIAPFGNYQIIEKFTGALDRIELEHIKVYVGRGVGGGSLVNGGMAVLPKQNYFKEILPSLNDVDFYNKYFPLAKQMLKVNEMPAPFFDSCDFYNFARTGETQALKAGFKTIRVPNVYDFNYMQEEYKNAVPRSAFNGEVIYGNNYGKNSLDKTYLKEAIATGLVTILDLSEVTDIIQNVDNTYTLNVKVIDTGGNNIANTVINCKKLFLCAGSMGSTPLLVKAKGTGSIPNLNDEIGLNWGNNGNLMTGRNSIGLPTGVSQSTIPSSGIDNWEDLTNSFFAEISPMPMNMEAWTTLYLIINKLKKTGNFYFDPISKTVKLNWDKTHTDEMVKNSMKFIDKMNAINGGTLAILLFNSGIGDDICYHPLGGCVIGKATDNYGRVKGVNNLYVIDGSLIPGTIGVNPFLTITALAEHCIEKIIKDDFSNQTAIKVVENNITSIVVNPNPFIDSIKVQFHSKINNKAVISIYTLAGELVYTNKKIIIEQGSNSIFINELGGLASGNYLLHIMVGSDKLIQKIIKI